MTSTVFVNGATLSDADWFNDVNRLHYTIFNDPADASAVVKAVGGPIQSQLVTAFTTGGSNTAYTLTPDPAIAAPGGEWDVTFHAASGATPTLAISGTAAKNLKYRDSTGAKQAITATQVPINWRSKVVYDGTDYVVREVALSSATSITLGTPVASTSGTSIDFTGIPATAQRVTIMFRGVSFNNNANPMVQIGSGSVANTGYVSAAGEYVPTANFTNSTAGFVLAGSAAGLGIAANLIHGTITLTKENASDNTWVCASNLSATGTNYTATGAGYKTLTTAIDRVRITTVAGTPTFDAGEINISYE